MDVEYQLTKDDLLDFNMDIYEHSPTIQRSLSTKRLLFPIIWVLIWFVDTIVSEWPIEFLLLMLIPAALWLVWYPRYEERSYKRHVMQRISEGRNREIFSKRRLSITSSGITDTTDLSASTVQWGAIEKIVSTDNHVFLYDGTSRAFVVPRRAFPNEEAYEEFIEAAEGYFEAASDKG